MPPNTPEPPPCLEWTPWRLTDIARADGPPMTLERFGVLDGSTLRARLWDALPTTEPRLFVGRQR